MTALYTFTNLTQKFAERTVLDIDFLALESGKIYGLLGPNGAGKTTLMKIMAFMAQPATGEIQFKGISVKPEQAASLRGRVVWVPQSPVMFTGSLYYNIEYPLRINKTPRAQRHQRIMKLLEQVELGHLAKSPAHRLSGGEAQRASIARALAVGAEVILFDEPTASVDFRSRGEIIRLIRNLHAEYALSLCITTHDTALATDLCHEHITLFDGKLVSATSAAADASDSFVLQVNTSRYEAETYFFYTARVPELYAGKNMQVLGLRTTAMGVLIRLGIQEAVVSVLVQDQKSILLAQQMTLQSTAQVVEGQ